jgi:hypothetical protein
MRATEEMPTVQVRDTSTSGIGNVRGREMWRNVALARKARGVLVRDEKSRGRAPLVTLGHQPTASVGPLDRRSIERERGWTLASGVALVLPGGRSTAAPPPSR